MLKESDNILIRRKPLWMLQTRTLSVTTDESGASATMANATPPITPPSPPPLAILNTTTSTTSPPTSPTTKAMATSFLASVAAAAVANTNNKIPSPAVTCAPVSINGTSEILDHYSLRWNNHQNHIMHAFDALLQSKALVDVTLVCRERSIHAHKIVLSACSPFFQRVFTENPCKHPVIVLKDFRGWVVQSIVDFMYRGEISVPQERLHTLMQAGESLQIRGLIESTTKEQISRQATQSPDDYDRLLDTSLFSSPDLERNQTYDSHTPTMVSSPSKLLLPSHFFRTTGRCERESKRHMLDQSEVQQHDMDMDGDCDGTEVENESEAHRTEISGIHSEICTSPMPRRKQARPRRRSGDFQLSPIPAPLGSAQNLRTPTPVTPVENADDEQLQLDKDKAKTLETVIKTELIEPMDEDEVQDERLEKERQDAVADADSGNGNDSRENIMSHDISSFSNRLDNHLGASHIDGSVEQVETQDKLDDEDDPPDDNDSEENEGYNNHSDEIMCDSTLNTTEGPEDLCTTKKDNENLCNSDTIGDDSKTKHNNNSNQNHIRNNKSKNNSNDNKFLNKTFSSSMANTNMMLNSFTTSSLRDLRLDRSHLRNNCGTTDHNQHKIEVLEAQMQAAAAAAVAANCENPFKHMEHQVDLSLAAAAAAVSHHHSREREREREHAMHREQREMQQQHNMYASNLLSQMGMPGMPNFGPGPNGGAHDRIDDSINRLNKDFDPNSPLNIPNHFNMSEGPPNPSSPLPFPGMSSALALTPPHMFGLDTPLGLFPPGLDPGKLYNPLMDMSDPRGMGSEPPPFLKKKMPRPKGQHSAPRGGPPRSWTNAELTEALQHVWNKKMTTSQASRIFGIPYNSLLMYVRGKYGKSLKLEQLRKDCISGPPLELLQMGMSSNGGSHNSTSNKTSGSGNSNKNNNNNNNNNNNIDMHGEDSRRDKNNSNLTPGSNTNHSLDMDILGGPPGSNHGGGSGSNNNQNSNCTNNATNNNSNNGCQRNVSPDLLGPNAMFNPFQQGFYPDFSGGFPGLPLSMLNLLPPGDGHRHTGLGPGPMHHINLDEDCKSDRSKQSSSMDDELCSSNMGANITPTLEMQQPLPLNREQANEQPHNMISSSGAMPSSTSSRLHASNVQD